MARPAKPKKKVVKNNTVKGKRYTRMAYLNRLAEQYINIRYCETAKDSKMDEWVGWLTTINPSDASDAEYAALLRPMRWQVVAVTICKSPLDGKEYHLISYGRTVQTLVAWREGISPLVRKVIMDSEKTMNGKHCVARSTLFTPINSGNRHIADIVRSQKKRLRLTDDDIEAIRTLADQDTDDLTMKIEQFNDLEIDDKIKVLFREAELESSRVPEYYPTN